MVNCPACGKENAPHRKRCVHCGGPLGGTSGAGFVLSADEDEHTELVGGFEEDEHTEIPDGYREDEHTKVIWPRMVTRVAPPPTSTPIH